MSWWQLLVLMASGIVAGIVNTIAGAGSLLTLPALILVGLPEGVANATNRIGVLAQSAAGAAGFHRRDLLDTQAVVAIVLPTLVGSLLGAILAASLPEDVLKPVLLAVMVAMGFLFALKPGVVAPPAGTETRSIKERPLAWPALLAAGIYGGFLQAGIGILLLGILSGMLRYDLVRANALKLVIVGSLTSVALVVFVIAGDVRWLPGLVLAIGTVVGSQIGVHVAITRGQALIRWFVLGAIVAVVATQILR